MFSLVLITGLSILLAQEQTVLTFDPCEILPGDTAHLEIRLDHCQQPIGGFQFDILDNSDKFQAVEVKLPDDLASWKLASREVQGDGLRILAYYSGMQGATVTNSPLIHLRLTASIYKESITTLDFANAFLSDPSGEALPLIARSGSITIMEQTILALSDGEAGPGAMDTISVRLTHTAAIKAFQFDIRDIPDFLSGVVVLDGRDLQTDPQNPWLVSGAEQTDGTYTVLGVNQGNGLIPAGAQEIARVIYAVDEDAAYGNITLDLRNVIISDSLALTLETVADAGQFRITEPPVFVHLRDDTLGTEMPVEINVDITNSEALKFFQLTVVDSGAVLNLTDVSSALAGWQLFLTANAANEYQLIGSHPNGQEIPAGSETTIHITGTPKPGIAEGDYGIGVADYIFRNSDNEKLRAAVAGGRLTLVESPRSFSLLEPSDGRQIALNFDWLGDEGLVFRWQTAGSSQTGYTRYSVRFGIPGTGQISPPVPSDRDGADTTLTIPYSTLLSLLREMGAEYPGLLDVNWFVEADKILFSAASADSFHLSFDVQTGVEADDILPDRFYLYRNYPNPFNASTVIRFQLPVAAPVEITIFNLVGEKVLTLIDARRNPGLHSVSWDGRSADGRRVNSGIYFYRLTTPSFQSIHKMLLVQ